MNFSETFIRRPIATSLMMAAIALFGVVAYRALPVSDLPNVDFPTLLVTASLPGASPETMATSVALQADGKIVVAGYSFNGSNYDFAVARYNADGSLDTTFNGTGKVITAASAFSGASEIMSQTSARQSDGKIVVAGYANGAFAMTRYQADGSLDTSFGGTGITRNFGVARFVSARR